MSGGRKTTASRFPSAFLINVGEVAFETRQRKKRTAPLEETPAARFLGNSTLKFSDSADYNAAILTLCGETSTTVPSIDA
jgi:hypothetical protein